MKKIALENNAFIGIWHISETVEELENLLQNKDIYLQQLVNFRTDKRKKEWLASRLLIQNLCGKDKIVCYNEKGKPLLADNSFKISISHTKDYAAAIVHPEKEVGIDIEAIGDKAYRLSSRFLSVDEISHIDKKNKTIHSLLLWNAKEVMFKIIGEENVDFIEHLQIFSFKPEKNGIFFGKEMRTEKQENYTFAYSVEDYFTMVWSV
jgi:phosphopantetheinyl transferase